MEKELDPATDILTIPPEVLLCDLVQFLPPVSLFCLRYTCKFFSEIFTTERIERILYKIFQRDYSVFFPEMIEDHHIFGSFPAHFLLEKFFSIGTSDINIITTKNYHKINSGGKVIRGEILSDFLIPETEYKVEIRDYHGALAYNNKFGEGSLGCFVEFYYKDSKKFDKHTVNNNNKIGELLEVRRNFTKITWFIVENLSKGINNLSVDISRICIFFTKHERGGKSLRVKFPPGYNIDRLVKREVTISLRGSTHNLRMLRHTLNSYEINGFNVTNKKDIERILEVYEEAITRHPQELSEFREVFKINKRSKTEVESEHKK